MSNKKTNTAAEAVAVLKSKFEAAELALNAIPETATPEELAGAKALFEEKKNAYFTAKEALEKANPAKTKEKKLKGVFILSPTGRFGLGYNVGEEASLGELQALELEEAGYFKLSK
jgi:hypothetical protein